MLPMANNESPGDALKRHLEEKGWSQDDLSRIIGRPRQAISEIIAGKKSVMPEMAVALGMAFGNGADYWMSLETCYRLSLVTGDGSIQRRAKLYEWAPIRDMERRGWIAPTKDAAALESELRKFFGQDALDEIPKISAIPRKSGSDSAEPDLTPKQRVWCFRVKQLGAIPPAGRFKDEAVPELRKRLRELATYPSETKYVPETLSEFGVRFVVVQPIPGSHIEGVTLWRDEESPVIGLSLLQDRLDSFWHTLMHEVSHVANRDVSIDIDLTGGLAEPLITKDPIEQRADQEACESLIPQDELKGFIRRVGPLYYREKIIGFAHRVKIHPAMIVGQLQHLGEIGWNSNRELTPKVRELITPVALTDGYGSTLTP